MIYVLILLAIIIGALMPVQAGINAELSRFIKHPYLGAFISFFVGTCALTLLTLSRGVPFAELKKLSSAPPYMFLGGLMGALFVGSSIFLIPKMGATIMIAAIVTGQLIMSLIIDHYGLLGLPVNQVTFTRFLGVVLLFVGLMMVIRKSA